jgi:TRAP-type mannitol/chloroaromatic compound transport system permease small subunit
MDQIEKFVALSDPGEVNRKAHNKGDRVVVQISNVFAWLFPILMIAIVSQVIIRQLGHNQAWLDDLQWWLYGSAVMVGIAYAVTTDSHVRVDIFYDNFSEEKKAKISIFGLTWLFLPFIIMCWDLTFHYAVASVEAGEGSSSPNGLHGLYLLKIFMNLTFIFIAFAAWSAYRRELAKLTEPKLWKTLLVAFPSTMFIVNLTVFYVIFWAIRLTTDGETTNREIMRMDIFDTVDFFAYEIKFTILITLVATFALLLITRLLDRGASSTAER